MQHRIGRHVPGRRNEAPTDRPLAAATSEPEQRHGDRHRGELRQRHPRRVRQRCQPDPVGGQQVGQVRHRQQQARGVRQPDRGDRERGGGDAQVAGQREQHRGEQHRGGVEVEHEGGQRGEARRRAGTAPAHLPRAAMASRLASTSKTRRRRSARRARSRCRGRAAAAGSGAVWRWSPRGAAARSARRPRRPRRGRPPPGPAGGVASAWSARAVRAAHRRRRQASRLTTFA